jgi:hypothetical protein
VPFTQLSQGMVLTAAILNGLTADGDQRDVVAAETRSNTAYGDLTTVGPSVTQSLNAGQTCFVIFSAIVFINNGGPGHSAYMSYAVSGASTQAASDDFATESLSNRIFTMSQWTMFTATGAGSHTFTCKYRTNSASDTGQWQNRRLIVKPF